jgi:hypothetical protein
MITIGTSMPDAAQATPAERAAELNCSVPLAPGTKAKPNTPKLLRKDLRTLALFIRIYCHARHQGQSIVALKGLNLQEITGKPVDLCPDCAMLLHHALIKRMHCPRDPKPSCKNCPSHCYASEYRMKIREVMRFSGKRLILSGRLDYIIHLLF